MSLFDRFHQRSLDIVVAESNGVSYVSKVRVNKVGRPCNPDRPKPIAILGKRTKPSQLENTHEITLANNLVRHLMAFKSLCTTFDVRNITLQFRQDGLYIVEPVVENSVTVAYLSIFFDAHYSHYYYAKNDLCLRMSTNTFNNMLETAKNETHFIKICVSDGPTVVADDLTPAPETTIHTLRIYVHLKSNQIDLTMLNRREVTAASFHIPRLVCDYYPFEFFIQSSAILSMLATKNMTGLRVANSSTSALQIMPVGVIDQKEINIGDAPSNILRNRLHSSETFNINLPAGIMKNFVRASEVSGAHFLHFEIHPTEATFLSYKCSNTRILDQFEIDKGVIERDLHSCIISLILPRSKLSDGRHNIISQGR